MRLRSLILMLVALSLLFICTVSVAPSSTSADATIVEALIDNQQDFTATPEVTPDLYSGALLLDYEAEAESIATLSIISDQPTDQSAQFAAFEDCAICAMVQTAEGQQEMSKDYDKKSLDAARFDRIRQRREENLNCIWFSCSKPRFVRGLT